MPTLLNTPVKIRHDERVTATLHCNPFVRPRNLAIQSQNGHMVIEGQVDSYFAKQMAQESLRHIDGILTIDNQLQVSW